MPDTRSKTRTRLSEMARLALSERTVRNGATSGAAAAIAHTDIAPLVISLLDDASVGSLRQAFKHGKAACESRILATSTLKCRPQNNDSRYLHPRDLSPLSTLQCISTIHTLVLPSFANTLFKWTTLPRASAAIVAATTLPALTSLIVPDYARIEPGAGGALAAAVWLSQCESLVYLPLMSHIPGFEAPTPEAMADVAISELAHGILAATFDAGLPDVSRLYIDARFSHQTGQLVSRAFPNVTSLKLGRDLAPRSSSVTYQRFDSLGPMLHVRDLALTGSADVRADRLALLVDAMPALESLTVDSDVMVRANGMVAYAAFQSLRDRGSLAGARRIRTLRVVFPSLRAAFPWPVVAHDLDRELLYAHRVAAIVVGSGLVADTLELDVDFLSALGPVRAAAFTHALRFTP